MVHYVLILVGALFLIVGVRGVIKREISWRRSADNMDRLTGQAGLLDTHTTTHLEGIPAMILGGAVAVGGLVMLLKGITSLG